MINFNHCIVTGFISRTDVEADRVVSDIWALSKAQRAGLGEEVQKKIVFRGVLEGYGKIASGWIGHECKGSQVDVGPAISQEQPFVERGELCGKCGIGQAHKLLERFELARDAGVSAPGRPLHR